MGFDWKRQPRNRASVTGETPSSTYHQRNNEGQSRDSSEAQNLSNSTALFFGAPNCALCESSKFVATRARRINKSNHEEDELVLDATPRPFGGNDQPDPTAELVELVVVVVWRWRWWCCWQTVPSGDSNDNTAGSIFYGRNRVEQIE